MVQDEQIVASDLSMAGPQEKVKKQTCAFHVDVKITQFTLEVY